MSIWFTADTHFAHYNIIKYCYRPFESAQHQDRTLIENWNSVVGVKDEVYHLGDVGKGSSQFLYDNILSKLNGKIYLIKGNHDKEVLKSPALERFEWVKDVHFLKVQGSQYHGKDKLEIFLSHYAHRTWAKSFHGSLHCFGHSHGGLPPHGKSFDVGVDCWNYMPVSLIQVVEFAKTLEHIDE